MNNEYLTVPELSAKIKYTEQSIYNLINKNIFIQGVHYYKPTPKKILFKWDSVINWIEGNGCMNDKNDFASTILESNTKTGSAKKSAKKNEPISSICI